MKIRFLNIIALALLILVPVSVCAQDNVWHKFPIYGGEVRRGAIATSAPESLIVVTSIDGYRSVDGGASWEVLDYFGMPTPNNNTVFIHPLHPDSVILSGHPTLAISDNFGQTWKLNNHPADLRTAGKAAISAANTRIIYLPDISIGSDIRGAIFKSTDQGENWIKVLARPGNVLETIDISQQSPNRVYAAFRDSLFRTNDGGEKWVNITNNYYSVGGAAPVRIFVSPYDANLVIITTGNSDAEMCISYNGGASWALRNLTEYDWGSQSITFDPDNQTIYMASTYGGLYRSVNRGLSWAAVSTPGLINKNIYSLLINSKDTDTRYVLTNGSGVYKTIDDGVNWLPYNVNISEVYNDAVAEHPANSNYIMSSSRYAGIFRSINSGNNWSSVNNGLEDIDIRRLAWPSNHPETVFALSYQSGVYVSTNNGILWTKKTGSIPSGAWYDMVYDSVDSRLYVACTAATSKIIYSDDWGTSWNYLTPSPPVTPRRIRYNPLNGIMYASASSGEGGPYKLESGNWVNLAGAELAGKSINSFTLHPSNPDSIYAYANDRWIYVSVQGGGAWKQIYYVSDNSSSTEIDIDPVQPHIQYLAHGYGKKSFDGGTTFHEFPWAYWSSMGINVSIHDRNTIYSRTRSGLLHIHQAPFLEAPAPASFGTVSLGNSNDADLTVRNTGYNILKVSNFNLSGAHDSHYQILDSSPKSLIFDETDTIRVRFQPDSVGSLPAVLNGHSNDPLQPSFSVSLSGTGRGALLSASTSSLPFGNVYYQQPRDTSIFITNSGNADLTISETAITGTHAAMFSIVKGGGNQTITAGNQAEIMLRFIPAGTSSYTASLQISSNDAYTPTHSISLSGKGVVADIDLAGTNSVNFGTKYLFEFEDRIFTIQNVGNATLIVDHVEIGDSVFTWLSPQFPLEIGPGASQQVSLRFYPETINVFSTVLSIYSNDPDENPVQVTLQGIGINVPTGTLELSQNAHDFPSTVVGNETTAWELLISNSSSLFDLQLDTMTIDNSVFRISGVPDFPYQMNPEFGFPVYIRFAPDSAKEYHGLLTIYTDATNGTQQVNLSGTGTKPPAGTMNLSHTAVNFGSVALNAKSDTIQVTLTNAGENYSIRIDSLVIPDPAFRILGYDALSFPFTISAGSVKSLDLVFEPGEAKTFNSSLKIYSNATNGVLQTIALTGIGTEPSGEISVSEESISFGTVVFDFFSTTHSVNILNTSSLYDVQIDSIIIQPDVFTYTFADTFPSELAAQNQKAVNVLFKPVAATSYSGTLSIYSNASNNNLRIVNLSGSGRAPDPPDLTFDPSNITSVSGNASEISLTISSDLYINYARLYYAQGGITEFDSIALTKMEGDQYSVTLPSSVITNRGLSYFFRVADDQFTVRYPETGTINLPVTITNLDHSIISEGAFQMISLPLLVDDSSPLSVLGDNLGEYDIYNWRMFRWIDGAYVELNDQDTDIGDFTPGMAFWLAAQSATSFNTGAGESTPLAEPVTLSLQEGWNQVGNPFIFNLNTSSLERIGSVGNEIWHYDTANKEYEPATVLVPWEGYFIRALDGSSSIRFLPEEGSGSLPVAKTGEDKSWQLNLVARAGSARDRYNFAGMHPKADDGYDRFDYGEPPPLIDYISLAFPIEETTLSTDVRKANETGAVWPMTITTDLPGSAITLTAGQLNEVPCDFEVWLIDKTLRMPVNLRDNPEYSFTLRKTETERLFELVIGNPDFAAASMADVAVIPVELTLYLNFPNPFNPETNIKFYLPEAGQVELSVYNTLGQRVRTVIPRTMMEKGFHAALWRGDNDQGERLASGMYVYVLRCGEQVLRRKMVLVK